MIPLSKLKGAIFDLDGTLLDSMGVWAQIDIRFLNKRNITAADDYIQAVTPMNFQQAAEYTINRFSLKETAADIIAEWKEMAEQAYAHDIKLKPHVEPFLRQLLQAGIPLGVATALTPNLYTAVLKNNHLFDLFTALSDLTEVKSGKGSPDVYLLTAEKLGVSPADCMVFEDISQGIIGAKAGGFLTCGVYDRYSDYEWDHIQSLSDIAITDFKQLLA